jgi:hypothetical protein
MTTYRMVDHGYPFKKIMRGKDWVGRVVKTTDGRYYARIGKLAEAYAHSELVAFHEAASKALGYRGAADLREHNRAVRAGQRARRVEINHAVTEFLGGNHNALDALFSKRGD